MIMTTPNDAAGAKGLTAKTDGDRARHTPGPWEPYEASSSINVRSKDGVLAKMTISIRSGRADEGRANARLIAAAPDLKDALTAALNVLEVYLPSMNIARSVIPKCRQALASTTSQDNEHD